MSNKDRGLGSFQIDRRREREAAASRSATSSPRDTPSPPAGAEDTPPAPLPPPRRRRQVRVQLNTRIAQDLHERIQAFVQQHDAAVQDVVETALAEYLQRRGA